MDRRNKDASVVQREALGSSWEGRGVDAKCDQVQKKNCIFYFCLSSSFSL
jgi:hypothetical protein